MIGGIVGGRFGKIGGVGVGRVGGGVEVGESGGKSGIILLYQKV